MRRFLPLLVAPAIMVSTPSAAQHSTDASSLRSDELSTQAYDALDEISIPFMLRGYVHVLSSTQDTSAPDRPRVITPDMNLSPGSLHMAAFPKARLAFAERYQGMKLILANTTDSTLS